MLTHELELQKNFNTYLTKALRPVRPLYTFGRSHAADPKIRRTAAVWDFWKDPCAAYKQSHVVMLLMTVCFFHSVIVSWIVFPANRSVSSGTRIAILCCALQCPSILEDVALPFIGSDRFERDTLFLVFENDFRFRPNDYREAELHSAEHLRASGAAPAAYLAPLPKGARVLDNDVIRVLVGASLCSHRKALSVSLKTMSVVSTVSLPPLAATRVFEYSTVFDCSGWMLVRDSNTGHPRGIRFTITGLGRLGEDVQRGQQSEGRGCSLVVIPSHRWLEEAFLETKTCLR